MRADSVRKAILSAVLLMLAAPMAAARAQVVPGSLAPLRDEAGRIAVRLETGLIGAQGDVRCEVEFTTEAATSVLLRDYFFEPGEDALDAEASIWSCRATPGDVDVVVAWFEDPSPAERACLALNGAATAFSIGSLLSQGEARLESEGAYVTANLLHHGEVGRLEPAEVGIGPVGDEFTIAVLCDTHTDTPDSEFNCYLRRALRAAEAVEPRPAFLIINGDSTGGQGEPFRFESLKADLEGCDIPVLLELGNHESRYKSEFKPGYRMDALANFFTGQRAINGVKKLLYSFDLGRWHFVVWPDPLRHHFFQTHPHYFDWLERDLARNKDRPTVLFTHIHPWPLGINPMTNYVNDSQQRRRFLEVVTRHGNVRYVLSGHTHIPFRASFKTARSYSGTNFVNLPATWSPGRSFGEADFDGEPGMGVAVIRISGEQARLMGHKLTGETYEYPAELPEFQADAWPLWLRDPWELPARESIINGGFEDGLAGWAPRFVYMEDADPSNIRRVDAELSHGGTNSLRMFCRRRDYYVPGDNRMTQTLNNLTQCVALAPGARPVVRASYLLEGEHYTPGDISGASIRVEGYSGSARKLRLGYWIGRAYFRPRGLWSDYEPYHHFDITAAPDQWHRLRINVADDYRRAADGEDIAMLGLDRLAVVLQVWNLNQHVERNGVLNPMRIGVRFDDVAVDTADVSQAPSALDGTPIPLKPEEQVESEWLISPMRPLPCER